MTRETETAVFFRKVVVRKTPAAMSAPQPQRQEAVTGLHKLGELLRDLDCFDSEDLSFWQDEIKRFQEVDDELLALQQYVPQRQTVLQELDTQYHLSRYFPIMLRKFAAKDAELTAILDTKKREQEYRHLGAPA